VAALFIVVIGVLVIGAAVGFGSEESAEPTAQGFLLSWQQQQYTAAGALTTAVPGHVASALRAARGQLGASALFLSMDSVIQHGATAEARFTASVDLAQQGRIWTYHGRFGLVKAGSNWRVAWTPAVIYPGLGAGDRLAVMTSFPSRSSVLDSSGQPLQSPSTVYAVGVVPAQLTNPSATADGFGAATGVDASQVAGQIGAAPPQTFLKLATLDPNTYYRLRPQLRRVPGLVVKPTQEPLFKTLATGLVGQVGSEIDPALRAVGASYLPGTTIGTSGLEGVYQRQLLGSPSTSIVQLDSAGSVKAVLARWPGTPGTSVRTTINSSVQRAALAALDSVRQSGELVAVRASTGQVLAVAQHTGSTALPSGGLLNARLSPGTAFTIVSTAALLESGLAADTPISCDNSFTVGGQTFTSYGTGAERPFSTDFAEDCSTAFAGLSERLTAGQFDSVVKDFGIGADWSDLRVPAFSGSVPSAGSEADLAAETIGKGNVQVSPLAMAMVAAEVASGTKHAPSVVAAPGDRADPANPGDSADRGGPGPGPGSGPGSGSGSGDPPAVLDGSTMTALRGLMRGAVKSGAAHAANVPGTPVYGQVGLTRSSSSPGWLSWFVGYRGDVAFCVIETGSTPQLSAAALAGAFLSALGNGAVNG
jgi:Penicillin binding protein transpeptidase domain/Penicillin-binding Protein dimerisation domain/NTF2-like N-terminal transpeptidase domain